MHTQERGDRIEKRDQIRVEMRSDQGCRYVPVLSPDFNLLFFFFLGFRDLAGRKVGSLKWVLGGGRVPWSIINTAREYTQGSQCFSISRKIEGYSPISLLSLIVSARLRHPIIACQCHKSLHVAGWTTPPIISVVTHNYYQTPL